MNNLDNFTPLEIIYQLAKIDKTFLALFGATLGWSDKMTDQYIVSTRTKRLDKNSELTL